MPHITYIKPKVSHYMMGDSHEPSETYYSKPSDPFEPIDTLEEEIDYGPEIDRKLDVAAKAMDELIKAFNHAGGEFDIRIDTGKGFNTHGYIWCRELAAIMAAMVYNFHHGSRVWNGPQQPQQNPKVTISFRTEYEAVHTLWNLMETLIENVHPWQRPDGWDKLLDYHTHGVSCTGRGASYNLRFVVLALKLIGANNWYKFRDSDDKELDDYGFAIISVNDENRELLTQKTDDSYACIVCKKTKGYRVALSKYTCICGECIDMLSNKKEQETAEQEK